MRGSGASGKSLSYLCLLPYLWLSVCDIFCVCAAHISGGGPLYSAQQMSMDSYGATGTRATALEHMHEEMLHEALQ
eukprot:1475361-Amphidinium_carterae.1